MLKRILPVVALLGLILWGIYDVSTGMERQEDEKKETEISNGAAEEDLSEEITAEIGILKGNLAPDFELLTLDGTAMTLSELKGKKVILNMWATWCPPCRAEMPDMQKFYEKYKDEGVEILAVNLTESEKSRDNVPEFIEEFGITFPVVLDENSEVATVYQAIAIPTSYIIDSNGIIHEKIVGPMNYDMMKQLINEID